MFGNGYTYSFSNQEQRPIQAIPEHLKKIGIITFKKIVSMANQCVQVMNTPFGQQLSVDNGKMYRLVDNAVLELDIHGDYIIKVNKGDNNWQITGHKE